MVSPSFSFEGALVFDIGASIGAETEGFLRQGASRVIAVEPQDVFKVIDSRVHWTKACCGATMGKVQLRTSRFTALASCNPEYVAKVNEDGVFPAAWFENEIECEQITLDALISEYGVPSYLKIDVEGYEQEVLAGLHAPVPWIRFEFHTCYSEGVIQTLAHTFRLGKYVYRVIGDTSNGWHDMQQVYEISKGWIWGDIECALVG